MERSGSAGVVLPDLFLLALAALGVGCAYALWPPGLEQRALLSHGAGGIIALLAAVTILRAARRPNAWRPSFAAGLALLAIGVAQTAGLAFTMLEPPSGPYGGDALVAFPYLVVAALLLILYRAEVNEHFAPEERSEALADIALLSVAGSVFVFLVLRPGPPSSAHDLVSSAAIAVATVVAIAAGGAVALRDPSPVHLGLFAILTGFGVSSVAFAMQWLRRDYVAGHPLVDLPVGLGALAMAALLSLEPLITGRRAEQIRRRVRRPVLTGAAVASACASLTFTAVMEVREDAGLLETSLFIGVLCLGIAARVMLNQLRSTRAGEQVARALADKERALSEADEGLVRLQQLHRSLALSEERLRLLVDAAVDGIVELDGAGTIRRANEALCSMLGLPRDRVEGMEWVALSQEIEGPGGSLASLPETGHAVLPRSDQDLHLEARASELPGPDPGLLLVVRDVTAARVADQTIRSLFKFLQDRDEDRTRLLKRTNAAIEAERNRVARDLHDGPVQGVSAVSLSLEAVLVLLRSGEVDKAISVLADIRAELSEETDNLRRLMSDLRPPILDERGLIPALREILAKFGRGAEVKTHFESKSLVDIPADVETLAYRIVQEALTNAGKHARASEVRLSVEALAGQLRVEITDDGVGFDPASARDFLRAGRVGLASMRERTELANGSLLVRSTPGGGTTIVATLPFERSASAAEPALS
jgi:signal transduction histidine kinase